LAPIIGRPIIGQCVIGASLVYIHVILTTFTIHQLFNTTFESTGSTNPSNDTMHSLNFIHKMLHHFLDFLIFFTFVLSLAAFLLTAFNDACTVDVNAERTQGPFLKQTTFAVV